MQVFDVTSAIDGKECVLSLSQIPDVNDYKLSLWNGSTADLTKTRLITSVVISENDAKEIGKMLR